MTDYILVQTSLDNQEKAEYLANIVVGQRLAACCWLSGPIKSTYWWQGQIEKAEEWVLSFKTRLALYPDLERTIKRLHPYGVPEIIATPIVAGSQSFLDWIASETTQEQT
jgi:periplasmic divalent cation tolerance protein